MNTVKIDDFVKDLAMQTVLEPKTRTLSFKTLGENLSLISDNKELKRLIHLYWTTIIDNQEKWQGKLFVPDYYRRNKEKFVYADVWYSIRDAWAWHMLYPQEASAHFKITDEGDILFSDKAPKPRLMEKENKVIATKNEVGAYSYETKKPLNSHKLASGFSCEGAHVIFEYLTFGYFEFIPKKPKKDDVSETDDLEGLPLTALKKSTSVKSSPKEGKTKEAINRVVRPSEKQIAKQVRDSNNPKKLSQNVNIVNDKAGKLEQTSLQKVTTKKTLKKM